MKKSKFAEKKILQILRDLEGGISVADLTRKHGVGNATIYKWCKKYGE